MSAALLAAMDPGVAKMLAIAIVMITAVAGAVLYPIAQSLARRLDGRARSPELEREVAALADRLESLEREQERMAELENRLDFAERMLAQPRDPARIDVRE